MKKLNDDAVDMLNSTAKSLKSGDLKYICYILSFLILCSAFGFWVITIPIAVVFIVWLLCKGCKKLYDKIKSEENFLVDLVGWSLFIVGSICLLVANGELL